MSYKKFDQADLEVIKNIIKDDERILYAENINEEYSHDELGGAQSYPDVVVKATSAEEISEIMKYAYENNIPVTPRGAGTGLVGSSVAIEHGIMIDSSLMNHILELDEENLTITVEPGVLLMELAAYVEDHDFFYPPDPGEKSATIGGNISTNAGGMRAVKYGVTRDYVRGLEVVLPNGKIVEFGGKVVKNSSGYSLKDLMIGSEGTLGFITKATLKLLPLPKKAISLLIPFKTLKEAIDTVPLIIKSKAIPTAIEFMQREVIIDAEEYLGKKFPDSQSDAYLLLKFDGNSTEEIEADYDKVAKLCLESGALDVLISDENVAEMKKNGKVVLLTASPEVILERVKDNDDRPLLRGNKNTEFISNMMEQRRPKYEAAADVVVNTDYKTVEEIAEEIVVKLTRDAD